jgi:hypothetical protein
VLSTAHLFIGAALGAWLGRPTAAIAAGVVSHHLADCILHTDPGTYRTGSPDDPAYSRTEAAIAVSDLIAGLTLLHLATRRHPERVAAVVGALAAIMPDVVDNGPCAAQFRATSFGRRYHAMHNRMHRTARPEQWLPGVATQAAAALIGAALLRRCR